MTKDKTTIIYTRVSTHGQAEKGDSIENQIKRCRAWLVANDYDDSNVKVIEEKAVSGKLPLNERPEGGPMFESLQKGDVLICYRLDRLFRNFYDSVVVYEQLKDLGIVLVIMDAGGNITDDILGLMYYTMTSLFASIERKTIAARTKEGSINRRAAGGFCGGTSPLGWDSVSDPKSPKRAILVPNPEQQKIVNAVIGMREKQNLSYVKISRRIFKDYDVEKSASSWRWIYIKEPAFRVAYAKRIEEKAALAEA